MSEIFTVLVCEKACQLLLKLKGKGHHAFWPKLVRHGIGLKLKSRGLIVTSSATDKKLEMDKKLENKLKIYKNLEIKLEIYKNLEIKLEIYSYFILENKFEIFKFFVNGRWSQ